VNKFGHNPLCSSLYLNEFLAIYYSNWSFKFQQYFCRRTDIEKVHQRIKKPCTILKLKSYMHLTLKHTLTYSVTSVLTKNHDIAIRCIFLPSSLQNDGKRGIYLAWNSNWNQGTVTHGVLQGSTHSIWLNFSIKTYRQVWWRLNAYFTTLLTQDSVSPM
jgi:hypothetical protein